MKGPFTRLIRSLQGKSGVDETKLDSPVRYRTVSLDRVCKRLMKGLESKYRVKRTVFGFRVCGDFGDDPYIEVDVQYADPYKSNVCVVVKASFHYSLDRYRSYRINIGWFGVRNLRTVVPDFIALIDGGPYPYREYVSVDGMRVYGNIYRSKTLDGVDVSDMLRYDHDNDCRLSGLLE